VVGRGGGLRDHRGVGRVDREEAVTDLVDGVINDRWHLRLTPDREEFHRLRPGWEAERLIECARLMKPGETVWDLGAESGDFTALYKQWVGPGGRVSVVEPSPPMWPQLRAHWQGNDLGAHPTWVVGFIDDHEHEPADPDPAIGVPSDGWPGCSVGEVIPDPGFRHLAGQPEMYPHYTIDSLVDHLGVPDHIVMDIEGAELKALEGAERVMAEYRPWLWVSVHPLTLKEWYDADVWQIHDLMRRRDYRGRFLGFCTEELWLFGHVARS